MYTMWLFVFLCLFVFIQNLEIIPTRHEITYVNPKYLKDAKITIRRKGRESPYYVNFQYEILCGMGNNFTIAFESFENLGGHYVPILFRMETEVCKLYDNPFGKMIVDQLPKNLTKCPIPPGLYTASDLTTHYENFPYDLPFTYGAVYVKGRVDYKVYITATKEPVLTLNFYVDCIQKPRNKQ